MIEVYHWEPNAHQAKPMIVLYEKSVPFRSHYVDILELEHVTPAYLKVSPTGLVPAMLEDGRLLHPGLTLSETTDFCEYIDERFPGTPLRPRDPEARWRMRWWCWFMDFYLSPSLSVLGWKSFVGPEARRRHDARTLERFLRRIPLADTHMHWSTAINDAFTEAQLAESRRRIAQGVRLLETRLCASSYLAGPDYSIADIVAFATLYGLPMTQPELSGETKTPGIWAWLKRIHPRPAIEKTFALSRMRYSERVGEMRGRLGI